MGVIDLDARVKKLEAGEGSVDPTVIDQLEATVTSLDETVNGDGETDFGLVGDVAALQAAAVPTKTTLTLEEGFTSISDDGGCFYMVCGSIVYLHFAVSGLTANTPAIVAYLPEAIRPGYHMFTLGTGRLTPGQSNLTINGTTGKVTLTSPGTEADCWCMYIMPAAES